MNIRHAINDGTHPSSPHLSIWFCRQMLAEFHEVNESVEGFSSDEIKKGQQDFHDFVCRMYNEMYNEPESFMIPVGPYDEYLKTAKTRKGAEKEHYTDTKESKLRNEFQKAIQFYAKFLYEIGIRAESVSRESHALNIDSDSFDEAKKASGISRRNPHPGNRQTAWKILGIRFHEKNGTVEISNSRFPGMFIGLWMLCYAPESAYKYMNYLRVDFQGCHRAMPGIKDIKETLLPKHALMIDKLEEALEGLPMKVKIQRLRNITSGFQWKAAYSYKGKSVFGFYAEPKYLMLCIYFNDTQNINQMSEKLLQTDRDLFDWFQTKFQERTCKCRYNRRAVFEEEKRRICGLSCRAEVENPEESDVADSIKIMKLFRGL